MPHAHLLFVDFLKLSRAERVAYIAQHSPKMVPALKRAALNAKGV